MPVNDNKVSQAEDPGPRPLSRILEEEYIALHGPLPDSYPSNLSPDERLKAIFRLIHSVPRGRSALCLSGGGVRGATFCLGIIQGLARFDLLKKFDYLSTVSGGGHIGGWLTAWIHRHPHGVDGVTAELRGQSALSRYPEPLPVAWLRSYINYLNPRIGIFSQDSMTIISTYLRNLFMNWLVLIPLVIAGLMLPRMYVALTRLMEADVIIKSCSWGGCIFLVFALTYLHSFRPSLKVFRSSKEWSLFESEKYVILGCVLPMFVSALLLTASWAWFRNAQGNLDELILRGKETLIVGGALLHLASWLFSAMLLRRRPTRWFLVEALVIIWSGALAGYLLWETIQNLFPAMKVSDYAELYACVAIPIYTTILLTVTTIVLAVTGRYTSDEDRAWLSRTGAWVLMVGVAWGLLSGLVIVSSILLAFIGKHLDDYSNLATFIGGSIATVAALIGAFSSRTRAAVNESTDIQTALTDLAVRYLAAPALIVFLMAVISLGTSFMLHWLSSPIPGEWNSVGLYMPDDRWDHMKTIHNAPLLPIILLWTGFLYLAFSMNLVLDLNKFSLHAVYRERLMRVYLSASHSTTHNANVLTGHDQNDHIQMHSLRSLPLSHESVQRPFHLINIALNLASGKPLAWQERKTQSFSVTPLHCGSRLVGYRPSLLYGTNLASEAITLGTALAISGVTANRNIGYHLYPPVAVLMTLFNVRLGWWLGNPGPAGRTTFQRSCPRFAIRPVVGELLGLNNETKPYVYLSDGGHFETLGLYEMVIRRCHCIVVVDAGCDTEHTFEDFANAVRKIRIDLGVTIEIDVEPLQIQEKTRFTREHWAIGAIKYSYMERDARDGVLIYVKPSLTGDEPVDVLQYHANHEEFPHESILDQYLDESQFECYRQLGEHIGMQVFANASVIHNIGVSSQTDYKVQRESNQDSG